MPRGACREGRTAAEAAGWGVLIAPEHRKPPVQLWRSEALLDSAAPLPLGSLMAAAVLGWGWRLLCGRVGCFYEVLSAGKKQTARRGRAAAGLQWGMPLLPAFAQPWLRAPVPPQGCLSGPPGPILLTGTRPGRHPRGAAVAPRAPQGCGGRGDPPHASWALQESSPLPRQCQILQTAALARRTTDLGAHGDGCHRGRVSTTRARGHRSVRLSALDGTTQTGTAAGRCRRHFGQGSGCRGEEPGEHGEPSIWWLRKQPGPGGEGLARAAGQAARTTRPMGRLEDAARSTPGACAHTRAHPSPRELAAPRLPRAASAAPNMAAPLEPETSLLRPASRSQAGPPGPGSPQNRPSLLLSSSPLLIYPPLSVPSEQPSAPLPSLSLSPRASVCLSLLFPFPFLLSELSPSSLPALPQPLSPTLQGIDPPSETPPEDQGPGPPQSQDPHAGQCPSRSSAPFPSPARKDQEMPQLLGGERTERMSSYTGRRRMKRRRRTWEQPRTLWPLPAAARCTG